MNNPITGGELAILRETVRGKGDTPAGRLITKIDDLEQQVARLTEIGEKRENHIQELLDDVERLTEERDALSKAVYDGLRGAADVIHTFHEAADLLANHNDYPRYLCLRCWEERGASLAAKDEALRERNTLLAQVAEFLKQDHDPPYELIRTMKSLAGESGKEAG